MASPLFREIVRALEKIDGIGFYHAGAYYANASDCDLLRQRTAHKLARLDAAERARRIEVYRLWCEGKDDCCRWCGLRFASIRDCVLIDGHLYHGFFCSSRWQEVSAERIEITREGTLALKCEVEARETEAETRLEKRAMFREGSIGCEECEGSFVDLSAAVVEDSRLVHRGCRAKVVQ